MSGTLMAMVYYGLQLLSPNYFYMTAALICAIVALSIGSSWTVVATIGIGLVGIAANMELSPAVTAGAVISGAYFGDKSSPLSDTANLAAAVAGADLYQHIKETLWTSVPALLITLAILFFMGEPGDFDASEKMENIRSTFDVSLVHFLPLVVVIALAIMKVPPFTTIMMGALAGALLAVATAPERVIAFAAAPDLSTPLALLKGAWLALASGYSSTTGYESIDMLASRGGMERMLDTIWLIIVALAFGGVVEKSGAIDRLIAPVLSAAKSTGALVSSLIGATVTTNVVTADQYIAIVLPGRMFKGAFEKRGLAPVVMSRALGDSATVSSALIPWNSCGAFMAATLGVATVAYAPFTFFNFLNPLISIVYAFLGFRMLQAAPAVKASTA
jgi:NhaC family Na+:H+ antiporter